MSQEARKKVKQVLEEIRSIADKRIEELLKRTNRNIVVITTTLAGQVYTLEKLLEELLVALEELSEKEKKSQG